jgi:hypothetical protein
MSDERRPQMHFSSLDLLWRCGEAFRRRYIERERLRPTAPLVVGKAVDLATNQNLQNKIDRDEFLPVEQVQETARDSAQATMDEEGLEVPADERALGENRARGAAIDKAVRLARKHSVSLAPRLKPKLVQQRWAITIPGIPFDIVGTRDLDETNGDIRDLKTSGKTPPADMVHRSDQLTLYALAKFAVEKEPPPRVWLDTIVDLKKGPTVVSSSSRRGREDFAVMLNRIENAAEVLEKGAFTPARQTDWFCSASWCGFFASCKFARQSTQHSIGMPEE